MSRENPLYQMENSQQLVPAKLGLSELLEDERAVTREQLQAAWQLHVERVEEQLRAGWGEQIERVIEERFAGLTERIERNFQKALATRLAEAGARLKRDAGDQLNQAARRLKQCSTTEEMQTALLDAAAGSCGRAALFVLSGNLLKAAAARGFAEGATDLLLQTEATLESAPAFSAAAETMDTVIVTRTAGELSEPLVSAIGAAPEEKSYLLPVVSRGKVAAVLYAEGSGPCPDIGTLELMALLAGALLEVRGGSASAPGPGLVAISGVRQGLAKPDSPDWNDLPKEEQELHLRAQRFGRVRVAEMRLYQAEAVRSGRASKDLYRTLRSEIDSARDAFRLQFVDPCSTMVDYLHLEVVRTLANNDLALLGSDYPGPLV